ncbi:DUF2059 domain-containing protein, partial [Ideonella sp.]|uniref:DUF2059 domain-containing protein n=1 Tax=Ideonella sp. TaxID=1929293 RepID=UPI003BB7418D
LPCALLLALCLSAGAQAQTKKELATKIVQLQQSSIDGIARNIAGQTAQQVLAATAPAVAQLPADKREAIGKDVQAEIKRFHDELAPLLQERAAKLAPGAMIPLLEEKMSEDELKQLLTWLESPAARKFNQLGPELLNGLQQQLVADTRGTVQPKLKTLEENLRKKLGLPASAAPASTAPTKPAKAAK